MTRLSNVAQCKVGTPRRGVRVVAGADARAARPYLMGAAARAKNRLSISQWSVVRGPWSFAFCFRASGQFSIDWQTIDGGGGTSTGGVYSVSGTIGQSDAGATMTGGQYSLDGGFWSIIGAVQTPGAPRLTIINTGTNAVQVLWPNPSTGWVLQQSGDVPATAWVDCLLVPVVEGTNRCVTVTPPVGNLFFRLKQ